MLALSTAYFTLREREVPGPDLAVEALDLGFSALELDYRLSAGQLRGLRPHLARGALRAVSVHHPFPRHPDVAPRQAHEERARLSALDPAERRAALGLAVESLAHAQDLGAAWVVLHLGEVAWEEGPDPRGLGQFVREGRQGSAELQALREAVVRAREAAAAPFLDAVLSSIDRLAGEALRRGVGLALENRYHPHQIPTTGELRTIFRELGGAPLGYWHDTGHARSQTALGFLGSETEPLESFGELLAGMHLHDARGVDDHLAPGEGDLDFRSLAPFAARARLVLEVHPPGVGLRRARRVLAEAGLPVGPVGPV